jgi:thioredoxin 1
VGDQASIVKIDVDRNPNIAEKMGIRGVPTFILFQNGEAKWRSAGMQSANALKLVIRQAAENQL